MYEIARINDDGTKTVIGATVLNFVSVGLAYDLLENKVTATLDKYMDSRDLKSEDKIKLLATTIGNIVTQSMSTVELEMKVKLLDAQIENERADISLKNSQKLAIDSEKTIKENQSAKDLLVKQAQIDSEAQRVASMIIDDNLKESQIQKLKYDIATVIASLEKQYGAKINPDTGKLEFLADTKSVISEQIDGFRQSGIKEIYKSSMQGIGMIYNAGETIPQWLVDIVKRTAEILGGGDIDLKKNTTTSETEMTPETTWDK